MHSVSRHRRTAAHSAPYLLAWLADGLLDTQIFSAVIMKGGLKRQESSDGPQAPAEH